MLHEDRRMLKAYREGEGWALEALYRTHAPGVATLLRQGFSFEAQGRRCRHHGVRSEFELEDRLQEVFLKAFGVSARRNYDGLRPFEVYLRTITRNLIIDEFRSKRRALEHTFSLEEGEPAADDHMDGGAEPLLGLLELEGQPESDRARSELLAHVEAFRRQLKPREEDVYRLRFQEELEIEDIAGRTGLSVSQVRTSEARIRVSFFRFMRRHGYFDGWQQTKRGWLARITGGLSLA